MTTRYNAISFVSVLRNNMVEPTFNPCKSIVFSYFMNAFYSPSFISSWIHSSVYHTNFKRNIKLELRYNYKNFMLQGP